MSKQIFINLPVKSLPQSEAFYRAIGFTKNELFSDQNATSMVWSDEIQVMLLKHDFFKKFIAERSIPDAAQSAQVLLCLTIDSKEELDKMVDQAKLNGGSVLPKVEIEGAEGMYGDDIADPDGHIWELLYFEMPE